MTCCSVCFMCLISLKFKVGWFITVCNCFSHGKHPCIYIQHYPLCHVVFGQERIAKAHGSQCGFCTPGLVMSMYALLRNNSQPTMQDIEEAFQGRMMAIIWKLVCHLFIVLTHNSNTNAVNFYWCSFIQVICVVALDIDLYWRATRPSPR